MSESAYIEKKPEEIVKDAQVTALRTLHKLTGLLERELESVTEFPLPMVSAFRHAVAAVEALGSNGLPVVHVSRLNEYTP